MERQPFPEYTVAQQWVGSSGILCVQRVEIAPSPLQAILSGSHGIRVRLIDAHQNFTAAFIMNEETACELLDLLDAAINASEEVSGKH